MQRGCLISVLTVLLLFVLLFSFLATSAFADVAADGKIVIVLDPGHGGIDGGTVGTRTEKEYNLDIALYLKEYLDADGRFSVYLTRTGDDYLKILPRALVAMEKNADLFLSLHCNSNTETYVNGIMALVSLIEPYCADELAAAMLDNICAAVPIARGRVQTQEDTGDSLGIYYWSTQHQWDMPGASHLGQKSDYYSVNTWGSKFGIPSIIVEHAYLSNWSDRAILDNDDHLRAIARAEADAIIAYYTNHEHVFGEVRVDFPSSCTLTGTQSARCTICGAKSGTTPLPAAPENHFWRVEASLGATCTTDGYIQYVCQPSYNLNDRGYSCTVHRYTETLHATGHTYAVTEDTPSVAGKDGRLVQTCSTCGDTVTEIRSADVHQYEITENIPVTCTEEGRIVRSCTHCGDTYTETTPATGHTYEVASATETARIHRCTACGDEYVEEIPPCEHIYNMEEIPATCAKAGSRSGVCTLCGHTFAEEIPALPHSYEILTDLAPTCTKAGILERECTKCGDHVTEHPSPTGHSFVSEKKGLGKITRICGICEEAVVEKTGGALVPVIIAVILAALSGAAYSIWIKRRRG